jgi:hypothetical protein
MSGASTDPFADAMRVWSTLASSLPTAGGLGGATPSPLDAVLMQAHWLSSASLVRAGQRAAQSWLQCTQEAPAGASAEQRVEAARAHLRRLAEIAADEARGVEQQLRGLDEQVRATVAPQAAEARPVRRAHPKP